MRTFGRNHKKAALHNPAPVCPRCGNKAMERETRYGIRSECCGLHSWDRGPLVDQATHDARKKMASLMHDLRKNIGAQKLGKELEKRTKLGHAVTSDIKNINEATCKKIIAACEDILVDMVAGAVSYAK